MSSIIKAPIQVIGSGATKYQLSKDGVTFRSTTSSTMGQEFVKFREAAVSDPAFAGLVVKVIPGTTKEYTVTTLAQLTQSLSQVKTLQLV